MHKEIKFDIREEDDKIICKVVIPAFSRLYPHKTRFRTYHIKEYLHSNNFLKENYVLTKEGYINNHHNPPILESEWVYSKKEKQAEKPKRPSRKRKTVNKTK